MPPVAEVGSWWSRQAQIDVVGVDRHSRSVVFGEARWRQEPFTRRNLERLVEQGQHWLRGSDAHWDVHYAVYARSVALGLRALGVSLRVIFGDEDEVLELLGKSTSYVERTHLTMRLFDSRSTRKTLGFSKDLEMYRASAAWEDLVYNFARPVKTLRVEIYGDPKRRWKPRTPAMTAGLTDHIWTVKELLKTVAPP